MAPGQVWPAGRERIMVEFGNLELPWVNRTSWSDGAAVMKGCKRQKLMKRACGAPENPAPGVQGGGGDQIWAASLLAGRQGERDARRAIARLNRYRLTWWILAQPCGGLIGQLLNLGDGLPPDDIT